MLKKTGHMDDKVKRMEDLEDRRWDILDAIEKRTGPGKPKDSIVLALEDQVRRINNELDRICKELGLPE